MNEGNPRTRRGVKRMQRFALWLSGECAHSQHQAESFARAIEAFRDASDSQQSFEAFCGLMDELATYRAEHPHPEELCLRL